MGISMAGCSCVLRVTAAYMFMDVQAQVGNAKEAGKAMQMISKHSG
jgi:hypothetical protein